MGRKIEMIGKKYGRWLVIEETNNRGKNGDIRYFCKCNCGTQKEVSGRLLRSGQSTSCGCYNKEIISKPFTKVRGTKLYSVFMGIKRRCYNQNCKEYKNYGGRGIKMCEEWKNNYTNFYQWAMNNGYKQGLWIDRIDNSGNYEPTNCKWATPKQQQNNKRTNRNFTYENETHTIKEWSIIKNINYATLMQRIEKGKEPFLPVDITKRHNIKNKNE